MGVPRAPREGWGVQGAMVEAGRPVQRREPHWDGAKGYAREGSQAGLKRHIRCWPG